MHYFCLNTHYFRRGPKIKIPRHGFFATLSGNILAKFQRKGLKLAVNKLETCASFVEILVLRNKAICTLGLFSGVGKLDLKMC